jgi:FG-GAP repeat/Concanavalin A-like lectin/glucanases superfamily
MAVLVAAMLSSVSADGGTVAAVIDGPCVLDTSDLLGWWRGQDDLTGEVGPDLTGSSSFGPGAVGRAMVVGPNDAIEASGLPTVSSGVSVEMWMSLANPSLGGATQTLMSRWDDPGSDDSARSFSLSIDPFANLVWSTDEVTLRRPVELRAPAPQLLDGQLHHVVATWSAQAVVVYLDGVAIATAPSQGGELNGAPSTPLRLGSKGGLGPRFAFEGVIDEAAISARALSAGEVAALYAAGANGRCVQQKLVAADGAALDLFGSAVAIDGDTIVVGAPQDSDAGSLSGSALVYTAVAGVWTQQAKLTASDAAAGDLFGTSVAIEGDTIVVGAYGNDDGGANSGSAYVFTRSGSVWSQQAELTASDASTGDWFGHAVSLSGDTVVVGAYRDDDAGTNAGATYVFDRSASVWSQQSKLIASGVTADDWFGSSVAIEADSLVVGAPQHDGAGTNRGAAYVFTRSAAVWTEQASLSAGLADGDLFGGSVAISGDTAVVGSHLADPAGSASGTALVFTRSGTIWSEQASLVASDGAVNDYFGLSVSIEGDLIAVGAPFHDADALDSGSVYLFSRAGSTWSQRAQVRAKDAAVTDRFGRSVSLGANRAVAGAFANDQLATDAGAAYVFDAG